jgi:hypothetical protein
MMQWAAIWTNGTEVGVSPYGTRAEAIQAALAYRGATEDTLGGVTFLARVYPPGHGCQQNPGGSLHRCDPSDGTALSSRKPGVLTSPSSRSATRRAKRERKRTSTSNVT